MARIMCIAPELPRFAAALSDLIATKLHFFGPKFALAKKDNFTA